MFIGLTPDDAAGASSSPPKRMPARLQRRLHDRVPEKQHRSALPEQASAEAHDIAASSEPQRAAGAASSPLPLRAPRPRLGADRAGATGVRSIDEDSDASDRGASPCPPKAAHDQEHTDASPPAGAPASSRARKANTLSAIEQIRANREARRQRQGEQARAAERENARADPLHVFRRLAKQFRQEQGVELGVPTVPEPGDALDDMPPPTASEPTLRVCVRKRPLNDAERKRRELDVVSCPSAAHVLVHEPQTRVDMSKCLRHHHFPADRVFSEACSSRAVFAHTVAPLLPLLVPSVPASAPATHGAHRQAPAHVTCFAYGQTGSGKTYTMSAVFRMAVQRLFGLLSAAEGAAQSVRVVVSFFELYMGRVFDLLHARAPLTLQEDAAGRVCVGGLQVRQRPPGTQSQQRVTCSRAALAAVGVCGLPQ